MNHLAAGFCSNTLIGGVCLPHKSGIEVPISHVCLNRELVVWRKGELSRSARLLQRQGDNEENSPRYSVRITLLLEALCEMPSDSVTSNMVAMTDTRAYNL